MILSFKKTDNLLLYLSLKVGENVMNSQHLKRVSIDVIIKHASHGSKG